MTHPTLSMAPTEGCPVCAISVCDGCLDSRIRAVRATKAVRQAGILQELLACVNRCSVIDPPVLAGLREHWIKAGCPGLDRPSPSAKDEPTVCGKCGVRGRWRPTPGRWRCAACNATWCSPENNHPCMVEDCGTCFPKEAVSP